MAAEGAEGAEDAEGVPSADAVAFSSSSSSVVHSPPRAKVPLARMARRSARLVCSVPPRCSSEQARSSRRRTTSQLEAGTSAPSCPPAAPRAMILTSSGSYCDGGEYPAYNAPSHLTPAPPGSANDASRPPGAVIATRAWIAGATTRIDSCARPKPRSVSPAAICSVARTRSTPVASSLTVCSTWMRGFASRKTYRGAGALAGPAATRNSTVPALR
mmetsp:Transcript_10685/g.33941  ORF Transcript_10685/g.33941 Transcript_10685/m.33941 type:complete len:216 (-) Transcript_10685:374-1021(-)